MHTAQLTVLKAAVFAFVTIVLASPTFEDFLGPVRDYFQLVNTVYHPETHTKSVFAPLHLHNWALFQLLNKPAFSQAFVDAMPFATFARTYAVLAQTGDNDLVYAFFHVVWLLTFNRALIEHDFPEDLIGIFSAVMLKVKVERITRIILLALTNLIKIDWYVRLLIQNDYTRIIPVLLTRQFSDDDILGLLQNIDDAVQKMVTETSSMQSYLDELKIGKLKWSPMHRSESFWVENILNFEANGWELVKRLRQVITADGADPVCVSVACFDLGEVARYHPLGRKVMNELDIKSVLLTLSQSDQPEVKKNALSALQKIMLQHWDMIQTD